MTEKEIFKVWLDNEIKKGLVDIHFCFAGTISASKEEIYKELNQINEAVACGRYSVIDSL